MGGASEPGSAGRRRWLLVGLLVVALVGAGYAVAGPRSPGLAAAGPTRVSGTEATAVFRLGGRTVRQVRYADRGTLDYSFVLVNRHRLPVRVSGIDRSQRDARLFGFLSLRDADGHRTFTVPAGGSRRVHLRLRMSGCEHLAARAGSFVHQLALVTERFGVLGGTTVVTLPEELHTGSPREAFCPLSTATSRPPG